MPAVHQGEPSKLAIFVMVARRSGPHLIEATIVPALLFYAGLLTAGLGAASLAALSWSYAALVGRGVPHQPVPPLLVIAVIGITVLTLVAVVSRSAFVYLFQPALCSGARC